jgi:hypothetical protein
LFADGVQRPPCRIPTLRSKALAHQGNRFDHSAPGNADGKFASIETMELCYDGKSIEQLAGIATIRTDRRLPADWLNVNLEALTFIDYPHLIFPQFEAKSKLLEEAEKRATRRPSRQNLMRTMGPNRNPQIRNETFTATLEFDEGSCVNSAMYSGRVRESPQVFVLTLVDEKNPSHSLIYGSWPDGQLRIVVTGPTSFVQIFQAPDGNAR